MSYSTPIEVYAGGHTGTGTVTAYVARLTTEAGDLSVRCNRFSSDEREYLQTDETHELVLYVEDPKMVARMRIVTPDGGEVNLADVEVG